MMKQTDIAGNPAGYPAQEAVSGVIAQKCAVTRNFGGQFHHAAFAVRIGNVAEMTSGIVDDGD